MSSENKARYQGRLRPIKEIPPYFYTEPSVEFRNENGDKTSVSSVNREAADATGVPFYRNGRRRVYARDDILAHIRAKLKRKYTSVVDWKLEKLREEEAA